MFKRLRHSKLGITADTYTHLLEGVGKAAAEKISGAVPRQRTGVRDQSVTSPPEG